MPRKTTLILTVRDLSVLRQVGSSRIATLEQLARWFWPDATITSARSRLRSLAEVGYLESKWSYRNRQPVLAYTLTAAGYMQLPVVIRPRVRVGWPSMGELTQQLLANDALFTIERKLKARGAQLIDWRSVYELRAEYASTASHTWRDGGNPHRDNIADAEMHIETLAGRQVWDVEIDGCYYGQMLDGKAKAMAKSGKPTLWVCEQSRAARVRRATEPYKNIQLLVLTEQR